MIAARKDRAERPYVKCNIGHVYCNLMYDSGAQVSCLNESLFQRFPRTHVSRLSSSAPVKASCASGNPLVVKGVFQIKLNILGKEIVHPFLVCSNIQSPGILGIDIIERSRLSFSAVSRKVFFEEKEKPVIARTTRQVYIAPGSKVKTRVKIDGPVSSVNQVLLVGVPDELRIPPTELLVTADKEGKASIFLSNVGHYPITLPRGVQCAMVEQVEAEELQPWDPKDSPSVQRTSPQFDPKDSPKLTPVTPERRRKIIEKLDLQHLPQDLKDKYLHIVLKYHNAVSVDEFDLGRVRVGEHKIPLRSKEPSYQKQFPLPRAHQEEVNRQLREWLARGYVRACESEYNSPLFCVKKKVKQGEPPKFRIVQDLRQLNEETLPSAVRLPEVEESIWTLCERRPTVFSAIDLRSGFWNVPLAREDQEKTAFHVVGRGQYCWTRSPMGLKSMPHTFQRIMNRLFRGLIDKNQAIAYFDDLLNFACSHEEMLEILESSFKLLLYAGFKVNVEKTKLGAPRLTYLGFEIDQFGFRPDSAKVQSIVNSPAPTTVRGVRAWIGMTQYFRRHVKDFSRLVKPLTALTGGKRLWPGGELPQEALQAFERLKAVLCERPILCYPNFNKKFFLFVDGSLGRVDDEDSGGLGAVLCQYDDEEQLTGPRCIGYASRTLQGAEKNYSAYLVESLAAVHGIEAFSRFLTGQHFTLFSDHKPLLQVASANHRRTHERLKELLTEYDFVLRHFPGREMPADVLSRFAHPREERVEAVELVSLGGILGRGGIEKRLESFSREQREDPFIVELRHFVTTKRVSERSHFKSLIKRFGPLCFLERDLIFVNLERPGSIKRKLLVLPATHHAAVVAEAHASKISGHCKDFKTVERIFEAFWWPSVRSDVQDFIAECQVCQRMKPLTDKGAPSMQPLPECTILNERIHMDLYGPLRAAEGGKKYVLVIIDSFTKFCVLTAIPSKEPESVAEALFKNWISFFGLPACILTDRGTEFKNKLLKGLSSELGIELRFCSTQHPASNGQAELMMKKLRTYLMATCQDRPLDWELFLPSCQLSWNSSVNKATRASPFSLLFGLDARTPLNDLALDARPYYSPDTQDCLMRRLQVARKLAKENNMHYREGYKAYKDKKNGVPINWQEGTLVWLHSPELIKVNPKIQSPFAGPFVILRVVSEHNVLIQHLASKRTKMVNCARLRRYALDTKNLSKGVENSQTAEDTVNDSLSSSSSPERETPEQEYLEVEKHPDIIELNPHDPAPLPIPIKEENDQDSFPPLPEPQGNSSQIPSPSEMGSAMARPLLKMTRKKAKESSLVLPAAAAPPSIAPEHVGRLQNRASRALQKAAQKKSSS